MTQFIRYEEVEGKGTLACMASSDTTLTVIARLILNLARMTNGEYSAQKILKMLEEKYIPEQILKAGSEKRIYEEVIYPE